MTWRDSNNLVDYNKSKISSTFSPVSLEPSQNKCVSISDGGILKKKKTKTKQKINVLYEWSVSPIVGIKELPGNKFSYFRLGKDIRGRTRVENKREIKTEN